MPTQTKTVSLTNTRIAVATLALVAAAAVAFLIAPPQEIRERVRVYGVRDISYDATCNDSGVATALYSCQGQGELMYEELLVQCSEDGVAPTAENIIDQANTRCTNIYRAAVTDLGAFDCANEGFLQAVGAEDACVGDTTLISYACDAGDIDGNDTVRASAVDCGSMEGVEDGQAGKCRNGACEIVSGEAASCVDTDPDGDTKKIGILTYQSNSIFDSCAQGHRSVLQHSCLEGDDGLIVHHTAESNCEAGYLCVGNGVCTPAAAAGDGVGVDNLLTDGGFESFSLNEQEDILGWIAYGAPEALVKVADHKNAGSQSLRLLNVNRNAGFEQKNIPVEGGGHYTLSFDYDVVWLDDSGHAVVKLVDGDADPADPDFANNNGIITEVPNDVEGWQKYERTFTAPAEVANNFRLVFGLEKGEMYIDDVNIAAVDCITDSHCGENLVCTNDNTCEGEPDQLPVCLDPDGGVALNGQEISNYCINNNLLAALSCGDDDSMVVAGEICGDGEVCVDDDSGVGDCVAAAQVDVPVCVQVEDTGIVTYADQTMTDQCLNESTFIDMRCSAGSAVGVRIDCAEGEVCQDGGCVAGDEGGEGEGEGEGGDPQDQIACGEAPCAEGEMCFSGADDPVEDFCATPVPEAWEYALLKVDQLGYPVGGPIILTEGNNAIDVEHGNYAVAAPLDPTGYGQGEVHQIDPGVYLYVSGEVDGEGGPVYHLYGVDGEFLRVWNEDISDEEYSVLSTFFATNDAFTYSYNISNYFVRFLNVYVADDLVFSTKGYVSGVDYVLPPLLTLEEGGETIITVRGAKCNEYYPESRYFNNCETVGDGILLSFNLNVLDSVHNGISCAPGTRYINREVEGANSFCADLVDDNASCDEFFVGNATNNIAQDLGYYSPIGGTTVFNSCRNFMCGLVDENQTCLPKCEHEEDFSWGYNRQSNVTLAKSILHAWDAGNRYVPKVVAECIDGSPNEIRTPVCSSGFSRNYSYSQHSCPEGTTCIPGEDGGPATCGAPGAAPEDADGDADGDGVDDADDSEDNNPNVCSDVDADACDDCSSGIFNTANDGVDFDGDGLCDAGDPDDDNDGSLDPADSEDNNPNVCSDVDVDLCDDCTSGSFNPANDGADFDSDGLCDAGDPDDDNDGVNDAEDAFPNDSNESADTDGNGIGDNADADDDGVDDGGDGNADGAGDIDGDSMVFELFKPEDGNAFLELQTKCISLEGDDNNCSFDIDFGENGLGDSDCPEFMEGDRVEVGGVKDDTVCSYESSGNADRFLGMRHEFDPTVQRLRVSISGDVRYVRLREETTVDKILNFGDLNYQDLGGSLRNPNLVEVGGYTSFGSVSYMAALFRDASGLTNLTGLDSWDVSNVNSMKSMFYEASALTSLNLSGWDVRNVEDMVSMFFNTSQLETLDISGWRFNNNQHDMIKTALGQVRSQAVVTLGATDYGFIVNEDEGRDVLVNNILICDTVNAGGRDINVGLGCEGEGDDPDEDGGDGEVADSDGDGIPDENDNCPNRENTGQEDVNSNNVGDVCEIAAGVELLDGSMGAAGVENWPSYGINETIEKLDILGDKVIHVSSELNEDGNVRSAGIQQHRVPVAVDTSYVLRFSYKVLSGTLKPRLGNADSNSDFKGEIVSLVQDDNWLVYTREFTTPESIDVRGGAEAEDFTLVFNVLGEVYIDNVSITLDNCPGVVNPNQLDSDACIVGEEAEQQVVPALTCVGEGHAVAMQDEDGVSVHTLQNYCKDSNTLVGGVCGPAGIIYTIEKDCDEGTFCLSGQCQPVESNPLCAEVGAPEGGVNITRGDENITSFPNSCLGGTVRLQLGCEQVDSEPINVVGYIDTCPDEEVCNDAGQCVPGVDPFTEVCTTFCTNASACVPPEHASCVESCVSDITVMQEENRGIFIGCLESVFSGNISQEACSERGEVFEDCLGLALLPADPEDGEGEDLDSDGDGVPNVNDNCPNIHNPLQKDFDGNGIGNVCDPGMDSDGDGVPVSEDCDDKDRNSSTRANDTDCDGVKNGEDICPLTPNQNQDPMDDCVVYGDINGNGVMDLEDVFCAAACISDSSSDSCLSCVSYRNLIVIDLDCSGDFKENDQAAIIHRFNNESIVQPGNSVFPVGIDNNNNKVPDCREPELAEEDQRVATACEEQDSITTVSQDGETLAQLGDYCKNTTTRVVTSCSETGKSIAVQREDCGDNTQCVNGACVAPNTSPAEGNQCNIVARRGSNVGAEIVDNANINIRTIKNTCIDDSSLLQAGCVGNESIMSVEIVTCEGQCMGGACVEVPAEQVPEPEPEEEEPPAPEPVDPSVARQVEYNEIALDVYTQEINVGNSKNKARFTAANTVFARSLVETEKTEAARITMTALFVLGTDKLGENSKTAAIASAIAMYEVLVKQGMAPEDAKSLIESAISQVDMISREARDAAMAAVTVLVDREARRQELIALIASTQTQLTELKSTRDIALEWLTTLETDDDARCSDCGNVTGEEEASCLEDFELCQSSLQADVESAQTELERAQAAVDAEEQELQRLQTQLESL